ncbi:hypothetical protein GCM10009665_54980 [Kitasatospora nipponensis]|uniref:Integral membrane protein n=1 Tax=Kitasatospora nipponensis TaxID=258049 RepID=A0ABN1WNR7_9ACTN
MHHTTLLLASTGGSTTSTVLALLLLLLPFLAPVVLVGTLVVLLVRLVRAAGNLRSLLTPGTLLLVAVAGAAASTGAFGIGMASGFYLLDPDDFCASHGFAAQRVVTHAFPVSARCVDGPVEGELVPGWVNPTVLLGAFTAVLGLSGAAGLVARRRLPVH